MFYHLLYIYVIKCLTPQAPSTERCYHKLNCHCLYTLLTKSTYVWSKTKLDKRTIIGFIFASNIFRFVILLNRYTQLVHEKIYLYNCRKIQTLVYYDLSCSWNFPFLLTFFQSCYRISEITCGFRHEMNLWLWK